MAEFKLEKIEEIEGKIAFYKLLVNESCEFDEFWEEIKEDGNLSKELAQIQSRMEDVSNLKRLPKTKFRDITPKTEKVKEYEIKTKNLRVYLIKENHTGKIIILGGKKSTQTKDIKRFRRIKKSYLE